MAVIWIPSLLRPLTQGNATVTVEAGTIGEVISKLEQRFPGIKDRLCSGEELRPGMGVVVDTRFSRLGLREPVGPNSEVHFVPAVSGG